MTDLAVGQTVRLQADGRTKTGVVRFVGQTAFSGGDWVGVELEGPTGKNDGSVQGERYFDCLPAHGMFVRPSALTILAQAPPPKPAPARRAARPSSILAGSAGRGTGGDASLAKRMSLNAPSPSPGPRSSRPTSIARVGSRHVPPPGLTVADRCLRTEQSPNKSPTKQLATAASSGPNSRTGTPSNARAVSGAVRSRPSTGPPRQSMGPPPIPTSRAPRPSGVGAPARTVSGAASRTVGARPTLGGARPRPQPLGVRPASGDQSGSEAGSARDSAGRVISPPKSDDGILSPQPKSPVRSRTEALEKLTADSPIPTKAPPPAPAPVSQRPAASTASAAAANREIDQLKTKLRVIEKKRLEDREKIKGLDKIQGERDRFEAIIQKLQTKYHPQQQENSDLKRLLKEAEVRLESLESLQAEHESVLELATLDREMAEEKAELFRDEAAASRTKIEELELELEVLKADNDELEKGMSPEERTSAGWLQMERNNERLREALIRLRDITRDQETELKDQIKLLEDELHDYGQVKEELDVSQEKLSQAEHAVEDLRQQLDNVMGAEDMLEELTHRNMALNEELDEKKVIIEDLTNLIEVGDELEINHVQNEREMQGELDDKDAIIVSQAQQVTQQQDTIDVMEHTLSRFRQLVASLQTDLEDMRASHAVTENESEQLESKSRAMMDLNMKLQISAAKAQVKTIDLELRRMEAQEAAQHLEIVKLFLPETYQSDRDSVLALLRFQRLAFKANLLSNFIKERANGQAHPGHEDDVFAGCDAIDKLTWVAAMCERFVHSISHCSMERFAKFEGALYELEPVERALNAWIDGLRRDDLKEQQCASDLQRTIALMSHLGEVHITDDLMSFADDIRMRALHMQSHLESAATTVHTTRAMVQRVIPPAGDDDELAQHFARRCEAVITQTRSAKVVVGKVIRELEGLRTSSMSLLPDTLEAFAQCEGATQDLANLARQVGLDLHQLLHEEGRTEKYTYEEVQTSAQRSSGGEEADLFATYLGQLRAVSSQVSDLLALAGDVSQLQEFDRPQAPWLLRSRELKALKTIPVDAEEELRRLKEDLHEARRGLAQRDDLLATAHLKADTLEARMRDAGAKAARIADLEAAVEAHQTATQSLKEDIELQDRELKTLETDRDKWKKIAGDTRLLAAGPDEAAGPGGGARAGQERAVATAREMEGLRDDIAALQSTVRYLRDDSRRARVVEQSRLDWLAEPLVRPAPRAAQRRRLVAAEGRDALGELVRMAAAATVYDLSTVPKDKLAWKPQRSTPQHHAAQRADDYAAWKDWQDAVLRKSEAVLGRPAAAGERARRRPLAGLQVRLPDDGAVGKTTGGGERGGQVQIVGSP